LPGEQLAVRCRASGAPAPGPAQACPRRLAWIRSYVLTRHFWNSDVQKAGSTPATPLTDAHHRIEREARPPMRCAGRRGRPPQLHDLGRQLTVRRCASAPPGAATPGCGPVSFRALLRNPRQKGADLGLPVATVAAKRPDRRELARLGPPGHCLRVNPEHRCNFCRRKQRLSLWCTC